MIFLPLSNIITQAIEPQYRQKGGSNLRLLILFAKLVVFTLDIAIAIVVFLFRVSLLVDSFYLTYRAILSLRVDLFLSWIYLICAFCTYRIYAWIFRDRLEPMKRLPNSLKALAGLAESKYGGLVTIPPSELQERLYTINWCSSGLIAYKYGTKPPGPFSSEPIAYGPDGWVYKTDHALAGEGAYMQVLYRIDCFIKGSKSFARINEQWVAAGQKGEAYIQGYVEIEQKTGGAYTTYVFHWYINELPDQAPRSPVPAKKQIKIDPQDDYLK